MTSNDPLNGVLNLMRQRERPLEGLRVLELGSLIAGPFATRIMAEFGAEVIKVERPGTGDPLRTWPLRRSQNQNVALVGPPIP